MTRHPRHPRCSLATTVRVRLADQSTVLVTGSGAQGALRSSGVALWHIAGAASLGVALRTAEVTGQALHTHRLLIRFAASAWVAVVGGVGRDLNGHVGVNNFDGELGTVYCFVIYNLPKQLL